MKCTFVLPFIIVLSLTVNPFTCLRIQRKPPRVKGKKSKEHLIKQTNYLPIYEKQNESHRTLVASAVINVSRGKRSYTPDNGKQSRSYYRNDENNRKDIDTLQSVNGKKSASYLSYNANKKHNNDTLNEERKGAHANHPYVGDKNMPVTKNSTHNLYDDSKRSHFTNNFTNNDNDNNTLHQDIINNGSGKNHKADFRLEKDKIKCCTNEINMTITAVNLTSLSGSTEIVKVLQPRPTFTPHLIWKSVMSIGKTLRHWPDKIPVLIKCPKPKPFFDERSRTCRQGFFPQELQEIRQIVRPIHSNSSRTIQTEKYLVGKFALEKTIQNITTNGSLSVDFPLTEGNDQNCSTFQKYEKREYAVLNENSSAVYIKSTGEVLESKDYYVNPKSANESQAIFVCRLQHQMSNCSGVYVVINEGEFRVLRNKSIFVNTYKQGYDWSEYTWQNKSVLVCVNLSSTYYESNIVSNDDQILSMMTLVCMSLSITGLVFVLVTYSLFSELRTPPGINLMNLSASILLAQLLWILGSGQTGTPMVCTVIAIVLHYLFLVSFVWTSIIAFDTWRAFSRKGRRPNTDSRTQRTMHCVRYMAVGWLPIMVYIAVFVTFDKLGMVVIGYGSVYGCWIAHYYAKLYFFGIPIFAFLIFNLGFYLMTVKAIHQTRNQTRLINANHLQKKQDFCIYVRVGALMGFTWIFGFAAPFGWEFLWYLFVVLNSLQGVYIALAFGVTKRSRKLYADVFRKMLQKEEVHENCVKNQEQSTKQSLVLQELNGTTPPTKV